jgi:hypothetical protein
MSIKELILVELEKKSEHDLEAILAYLKQLNERSQDVIGDEFLAAYQSSVENRREVYQRLADS